MNLTKNQKIYIISALVIAVIVYFVFFKKKAPKVVALVTPPAPPAPQPGESGYFGDNWGWGSGPQEITPNMAMASMSGPAGNSVAGVMGESGFRPANKWPVTRESNYGGIYGRGMKGGAGESNYVTPQMRKAGSGTNFLGY